MTAGPIRMQPQGLPRTSRSSSRAEVALFGVYEISKLLTVPARLETTLSSVLKLMSSFLDMRNGLIALLDPAGAPEIVVGSGWSEATAKHYFERLPERAIGQIVATKMPLVVQNALTHPLFQGVDFSDWGGDADGYSFIGVPIKEGDKVIGTLTIDRDRCEAGSASFDEDVRFLTMVASLVGQTVHLHRLIARDRERLITEQHRLEKAIETGAAAERRAPPIAGIVGDSAAVRSVFEKIRIVARSHSTVLLRGESGTGKELFARALHDLSPRKTKPFIKLNCAALPESVLESELFGHEKGAFTGAVALRKGRFELADGGTLFLDEIGEISGSFQAKLLRVLQEGEFERVGGSRTLKTDMRLVAATNRNLEDMVARGDFRADLYYRISVVPIFLPPLRDRRSDIPLLAKEFLRRFNEEHGASLELTDSALHVLGACYFPGNVRELENCVRRTATLAHGPSIGGDDFACRNDQCLSATLWKEPSPTRPGFIPLPIAQPPSSPHAAAPPASPAFASAHPAANDGPGGIAGNPAPSPEPEHPCPAPGACPVIPGQDMRSERERLIEAMETAGWVQAKAARILGLTPRQIGYAIRKHDIPIKRF